MERIVVTPDASSLVESLRDIGYSLEGAIADIVDNSITANAKNIHIYVETSPAVKIAVVDDGDGMSQSDLINSMKVGSSNPLDDREKKDLGRFGLGLKTASFSQCRNLTVVSRKDKLVNGACWDLDYISQQNDWTLQLLNESQLEDQFCINRLPTRGTIVIWKKTDRINEETKKRSQDDVVYEKIDLVKKHLELVFHRYLDGEKNKLKKINIFINNLPLESFDPFNKKNLATIPLSEETIPIDGTKIKVQPYILPHHSKASKKEYEHYAGVGGYLKNQGFYVYRNSRLLIHGTWFRIIPQKELYKLARVQIDLPNNLDHLWKIDVKKSTASPPEIIRERLKNIIDQITSRSFRVYEGKGHRHSHVAHPFWEKCSVHGETSFKINTTHPFIDDFKERLSTEQKQQLNEILSYIGEFFPVDAFFAEYGNKPNDFSQTLTDESIEQYALDQLTRLKTKLSKEDFLKFFKNSEPTNKYSKCWDDFMEQCYES